jgi:hypothetical protein
VTAFCDGPRDDIAYAFDVVLHPRPPTAAVTGDHADAWGSWPALAVPRECLVEPFAIEFDAALAALDRLPRMFVEPDGAIVWRSPHPDHEWQVDGTLAERQGRVLAVELKGCCPAGAFDQLLAAFDWPQAPVMLQLVRAGVFLDEPTFRRHAAARSALGEG